MFLKISVLYAYFHFFQFKFSILGVLFISVSTFCVCEVSSSLSVDWKQIFFPFTNIRSIKSDVPISSDRLNLGIKFRFI